MIEVRPNKKKAKSFTELLTGIKKTNATTMPSNPPRNFFDIAPPVVVRARAVEREETVVTFNWTGKSVQAAISPRTPAAPMTSGAPEIGEGPLVVSGSLKKIMPTNAAASVPVMSENR